MLPGLFMATTELGSRVTFRIWHPQHFLQYTLPWLVHNWSRPDHTELGFQRRGLHSAPYSRAIKFYLLVSLLVESADQSSGTEYMFYITAMCVYSIVVFRCLQIGDFGSVGVGDYHFSNSCRRAKEKNKAKSRHPACYILFP